MKSERSSSISFSLPSARQPLPFLKSKDNSKQKGVMHNSVCESGCCPWEQVSQQMEKIRRQLKNKVNRSEFISSLSTKLSISQLASINFGPNNYTRNKQNQCPNAQTNFGHQIQVMMQKILAERTANLNQKQLFNSQMAALRQQMIQVTQKLQQCHHQIQQNNKQLARLREADNERYAQIEAYVYRKADRSQVEKMFTLNQLLVVQIEQAKQRVQQSSRNIKQIIANQTITRSQVGQLRTHFDHRINAQQQKWALMHSTLSEHEVQLDKILDLFQLRQLNKQQAQQVFFKNLEQRLHKIEADEKMLIKQLTTRLNVVELRQNQMTRAARTVDGLAGQIERIKLDIAGLYEKSTEVSFNIRQFCETTIANSQFEMQNKFNSNIELACEQILKRCISETSQMITHDQFDQVTVPIKEKIKQLGTNLLDHSKKLQFLDKKQKQMLQINQQQIQKNQQRLSRIYQQMKCFPKTQQLSLKLKQFISIPQLKQLSMQLDQKISGQIDKFVKQQDKINQAICSQNILAKWFWTQTVLKGGNLIAWDKQIINTLPENFRWAKNEPYIHITRSGYYRIQMGFYSKKKPAVQLLVNGQTIISAVNSSSYVLHHSSGKLKDVSNSNGNGQIAGLTYVDFLLLPENARIVISYTGDYTGEGFLAIHRL